jgi:predicted thioesterase
MPSPDSGVQHVGVGILTHHLGRAVQGEEVAVQVRVDDVRGRSIVFACSAYVGDRLVALGTHHRVILRPAEGDR